MYGVIVADDQELFRAGLTAVLTETGECCVIAECPNWRHLNGGIKAVRPSLVVASISVIHDMDILMTQARSCGSRVLLVAEDFDSLNCYRSSGAAGIVHRSASESAFMEVVRKIREGTEFVLPAAGMPGLRLGARLAGSLTPTELTVLALLMEGLKNRRIAEYLDVANHVVTSRLQKIFNKTGFSNRLELALFFSTCNERPQSPDPNIKRGFDVPESLFRLGHCCRPSVWGEMRADAGAKAPLTQRAGDAHQRKVCGVSEYRK